MTSFSTPEPTASKRASNFTLQVCVRYFQSITCQATKGNKKRHKLGDKLGNKGDKALGRRTRLPTKENKKKDRLGDKRGDKMGDKLETRQTRPWEWGHTIQQRETRRERSWETSGETS